MNQDTLKITKQRRTVARNILIASIGNALEWFDFVAYGFFATVIAKVFFPAGDEFSSMLMTAASFGVPFVVRPIGAVVIGRYADRAGRKPALTVTLSMMLVGTLIIAITPSYESIGWYAPMLVVIARLIQGFSAGGEFGSATAFLAEQNPLRRGFYGSWQFASQGITSVLAAGLAWFIYSTFSPAEIIAWAWRIPFLCGMLIGPVGFVMRRSMLETEEFTAAKAEARESAQHGPGKRKLASGILTCAGLVMGGTVASYVLVLYLPTFAMRQLHLPPSTAFASATATGLVSLIACPLTGALSDRWGRGRLMRLGLCLVAVSIIPLFVILLAHPSLTTLLVCEVAVALILSLYSGPLAALMAEVFPARERTFGISIGYNISVTLFGGFAPMILTLLIHVTKSDMAPGWYVLLAMLISVWSVSVVTKRLRQPSRPNLRPVDV